jgi:2-polyprenyl-6-methoxyphenol hydroxylase-like FAD-dependent oxidoreductase
LATVDRFAEHPTVDDLRNLLSKRGPRASPALVQNVVWSAGLQVHHRLAMHYRSGRVFLAGDAAHVHSPAGAQGMNAGIQDALHLADELADVLTGIADDSGLKHYEAERRPVAEAVLGLTRRLSGVATLRGRAGQRIRNRTIRVLGLLPAFRRSLASRLSGVAGVKRSRAGREESELLLASTRR